MYLLLGIILLAVWIAIAVRRPDLRKHMLKVSIGGGIAGLLSGFWYLTDYWRPPTIVGTGVPSPEDFLFGFAITGIAATVYDLLFRTHEVRVHAEQFRMTVGFIVLGFLSLLLFTNVLGLNSILVSSCAFLLLSAAIVILRPDLLRVSLLSATVTTGLIIPIYILLFDVLSPEYWNRYWLLADTSIGVTILGNVPLTEVLWYFSWVSLAAVIPAFTRGRVKST
ncbi:MAG: lycopene cyclase domain-containing protein [Candidatus Peregrinibacteria bacterium]|nr:lycopene cyclase domain-containing protein [Candidatus Peregrinibacteria bacterium]